MYIKNDLNYSKICFVYDNCSPLLEGENVKGSSHLLEHLLCSHYKEMRDAIQANDLGEEAHTGAENMVIQFSGMAPRVESVAEKVAELIIHGKPVDKDRFLKEKETVIQEIRMKYAQPIPLAVHNMLREGFGFYGSAGTEQGVLNFSYEDYLKFSEDVFSKPWILSIGPNPMLESESHEELYPHKYPSYEKITKESFIDKKSSNEQKTVFITANNQSRDDDEALLLDVAISALSTGLQSPFMQELREKRGLVYMAGGVLFEMGGRLPSFLAVSTKPMECLDIMKKMLYNVEKYLDENRINVLRSQAIAIEEQRELFRYKTARNVIDHHAGYTVPSTRYELITKENIVNVINRFFGEGKDFTYIE